MDGIPQTQPNAVTGVPSAVPSWGHRVDSIVATQPDPIHGELGVLLDDGVSY